MLFFVMFSPISLNNWCKDHNDYSGEYEYDYDYPNPCDIDETAYDSSSDDNDNCLHTDFMNIPIVNELQEYSNATKFKPCCEMGPNTKHGYLHNDQCEVNIVNHIASWTQFAILIIISSY